MRNIIVLSELFTEERFTTARWSANENFDWFESSFLLKLFLNELNILSKT